MTGNVVSIVVAPPAEIGASFPKNFTRNGAHNKTISSRTIFASSAIVGCVSQSVSEASLP